MRLLSRRPRPLPAVLAVVAIVGVVGIPVLAASPSPSSDSSPGASVAPAKSEKPGNGPKQAKDKAPAVAVTLSGTVRTRSNAAGETEYTLAAGATTYTMDAGPAWFWKDNHPLKPYVGKTVRVAGEQREGSTEVSVESVDGKAVREPGKPPWAGGWKVVGKDHPGWSQEKADRWAAKVAEKKARFGVDCWPPGHCKDATGKPRTPAGTSAP